LAHLRGLYTRIIPADQQNVFVSTLNVEIVSLGPGGAFRGATSDERLRDVVTSSLKGSYRSGVVLAADNRPPLEVEAGPMLMVRQPSLRSA
jgi:hypothetical protein